MTMLKKKSTQKKSDYIIRLFSHTNLHYLF